MFIILVYTFINDVLYEIVIARFNRQRKNNMSGALVDVALAWHFAPKIADADVIYATFGDHKLYIGYFCKQILGKPLVVTIHAYELYANPNPRLFERALAACDRVVAVTEHNREILIGQYGVAPSNVEVVRIGVD